MKRKIITIDDTKCNGCGSCVPGCPEGALQMIDGKARLVSDLFCDGLGACIGNCPVGAITIEEREAEPYDERLVMGRIAAQGANTIKAHLAHLKEHGEEKLLAEAVGYLKENGIAVPDLTAKKEHVCPGSAIRSFSKVHNADAPASGESALGTWPVQLRLANPNAAFFENADLLIAADCTAFAYGNFHDRFMKGKVPVIFCPKLDQDIDGYIEKLAQIFRVHSIKSVTVLRMQVPCCGGTTYVVEQALAKAGKSMAFREVVISVEGEIL